MLMVAAAACGCAPEPGIEFPPVGYAGSFGETFRTRDSQAEPRDYRNQVNATVDVKSYVWQPWFITVDGGAEVATNMERGGTTGDSDSVLFGADVGLGILPLSRYPTFLSYNHTDSRADGQFTGSDFVRDRASVRSSALISSDLRTFFSGTLETIDQPGFGQEDRQQAAFSVNKTFDRDRLALDLNFEASEFDSVLSDDVDETDLLGRIRYDSILSDDLTSETTSTAFYSTEDADSRSLDEISLQGTTTAQWRPESRPFTVNGALRTLAENTDLETANAADQRATSTTDRLLTVGTVGLNYVINPQLTTNFGLTAQSEVIGRDAGGTAGAATSESETSAATNAIGNIGYQSLPQPLFGFDWRWDANSGVNLGYDTRTEFNDTETVSLGHGVQRDLMGLPLSPVQFSGSQQVLVQRTSEEGVRPSIFHTVSFTHRAAEEGVSTFERLSLSDRRDIAVSDPDEFQLAQLQLNRQTTIDTRRQWLASLSLQVTRQQANGGDADIVTLADGSISYREQDFFDVTDLVFLSQLTLTAIGLEEIISDENGTIETEKELRSEWRNTIEYRIGRIVASLEATLFYDDDERLGNVTMIRLRRDFSGLF